MARALFTLSLLFVVFTTVRVFGAPSESNAESLKLNRQKRTFGFTLLGSRDWDEFRRPWPFVTMTPLKSMMGIFEEENSKESLIKRLKDLENGHKRIIEFLKKIQATKSQCSTEKQPEPATSSTPASIATPTTNVRVLTDAPVQPTTQAPTPARITTLEVEDKTEPSATTKITEESEVEDKTEPLVPTKTTELEVEDKTEPPSPVKIESAEVEDKTDASTRPQVYSSAESTEQESTEKIEAPQVDVDVPVTTTSLVDIIQETTTQVDDNNDVNNVLV